LLENYYYYDIKSFILDYKSFISLKQKLDHYKFYLEMYQKQLNGLFYSIYSPGIKHKLIEFDLLNIFKRQIKYNSVKFGPKYERISDEFEYD
jgi:hypothetical protein